jgi:hypothetical protein
LTASGLPAGTPGSGVATAPYLLVATGGSNTARVYKLRQSGSSLVVDHAATLQGYPSPALATNAVVGPGAPPEEDGRVVVTTESNLYVLRAKDLSTVARLSARDLRRGCAPCGPGETAPPSSATGFYTTTAVIAGDAVYVERDDGAQLALSLDTAQPLPDDQFMQDAANAGSPLTRGEPAVADGFVVFAGFNGVFAYRLRADARGAGGADDDAAPPAPPPSQEPPAPRAPPPPTVEAHPLLRIVPAPLRVTARSLLRHGLRVRYRPARAGLVVRARLDAGGTPLVQRTVRAASSPAWLRLRLTPAAKRAWERHTRAPLRVTLSAGGSLVQARVLLAPTARRGRRPG